MKMTYRNQQDQLITKQVGGPRNVVLANLDGDTYHVIRFDRPLVETRDGNITEDQVSDFDLPSFVCGAAVAVVVVVGIVLMLHGALQTWLQ